MGNLVAAGITLANINIFGGKRLKMAVLLFLLPALLTLFVVYAGPTGSNEIYALALVGLLGSALIPFVSVFWGSAVLTDEVEGKTLVFLWTRPAGRARLFLVKFVTACAWLLALCTVAVVSSYVISYARSGAHSVAGNALIMVWDIRALALGSVCYAALALFFASLVKRPLILGLLYAYGWENIALVLPGFLQRFSIRYNMLTLATQQEAEKSENLLQKLLEKAEITELQAMLTLGLTTVVLVAAALWIIRGREFLGDDPARQQ